MADSDRIAIELTREQWRKVQARLMQERQDNVPHSGDTHFRDIVKEINKQLSDSR